jgi:hypothetical protein
MLPFYYKRAFFVKPLQNGRLRHFDFFLRMGLPALSAALQAEKKQRR